MNSEVDFLVGPIYDLGEWLDILLELVFTLFYVILFESNESFVKSIVITAELFVSIQ